MATITIQKEDRFKKTEFNSISELQEYIIFMENNAIQEFTENYKNELDNRENELLNDPELGINFKEFKEKYLNEKGI
jgi:hypothetical protein